VVAATTKRHNQDHRPGVHGEVRRSRRPRSCAPNALRKFLSLNLHSPLPTALEVLEDGFDGWLNGQTDRFDPAWRRNLYLLPTRNPECCLRRLDVSASSCQRRRGDRCRWEVSGFGGAEGAGVSGKLGFLKSHSIAKPYLRAECRSLREMSAPRRRMARSKSRLLMFR
jgi:hypothetical protein